jgi:hypothetical protein
MSAFSKEIARLDYIPETAHGAQAFETVDRRHTTTGDNCP